MDAHPIHLATCSDRSDHLGHRCRAYSIDSRTACERSHRYRHGVSFLPSVTFAGRLAMRELWCTPTVTYGPIFPTHRPLGGRPSSIVRPCVFPLNQGFVAC
jgi:hypothetical protein